VSISIETLKSQKESLKELLRTLEAEQRRVEVELKLVRQKELRTKREIEALSTLIELAESENIPDAT
jgi:predicted nuclease with TOPRIM domain